MKKYLLIGLLLAFNINVMAVETHVLSEKKIKTLRIDLDKEQKENNERGVVSDIIKGVIPLGHNDEVTFFGKNVLISRGIKIYINGIYQKSIKVVNNMFTLQTSDLKVGDKVTVKKRNTTLVDKEVVK